MKKRALSLLIALAMIFSLSAGLTVGVSAAGTLGSGMIVVNVVVQNSSNYSSPVWSGLLFNGTNALVSVSEDETLESGDIYSVDYDTGTVGVVIPAGSTAETAVQAVFDTAHVTYTYSGYLSTVKELAASGWNYWAFYHKTGGTYYYANLGLGSYIPSNGETLCLAFHSADGVDGITSSSAATSVSASGFTFGSDGASFAYDSASGAFALTVLPDSASFTIKATPHSAAKSVSVYSAAYDASFGYYMNTYCGTLNTPISFNDGDIFCIVEGSEEYVYYFKVTKATASDLVFYASGGYDYSMLGSKWTAANPLRCAVGEATSKLLNGYDSVSSTKFRYLSACTNVTVSDMSKLDVKVYYSSAYSESGAGYTAVTIPTSSASGTANGISYYNSYIDTYGVYYNFTFYPSTATPGIYYYYVVIEDTVNGKTVTSIGSQAVVKVGRLYAWAASANGVMSAHYITGGTSGLDNGIYYLKYQAKDADNAPLYFFTAAYAKSVIPVSGSVELSGAAKIEISLVKASDGSVIDGLTVS